MSKNNTSRFDKVGRWLSFGCFWVALLCLFTSAAGSLAAQNPFKFQRNEVVAFIGGANVVTMQETGHLEALLSVHLRGQNVRFRNLGWEADTVFAQPRDLNFPPLTNQLQRIGATAIFIQFGQSESLQGQAGLPAFMQAYRQMVEAFSRQTERIVLVTPAPFEKAGGLLPDLSQRNPELEAYVQAIRHLGKERGLPVVDLFEAFAEKPSALRLTDNGMHLTPRGHALVAAAFVRQLGLDDFSSRTGKLNELGAWSNPDFEAVRQTVLEKNQHWFNYWRPTNWAFLAGDRTEQPSSRDHRNPAIRWFPSEMEQYVPLIEKAEARIEQLANRIQIP